MIKIANPWGSRERERDASVEAYYLSYKKI